MCDSVIDLKHVSKSFGERMALRDVSLSICRGEIVGIVGPDGAGKTTLIRTMLGLFRHTEGEVCLLGDDHPVRVRARIGYVPQRFSLYADMTVIENIRFIGALYGIKRGAVDQEAERILSFTGLWEFRDRLAGHLSGGMKQKMALAAGLMQKPEVFFLDEPTTGVDPAARREFWMLLYELNQEGMTIVTATPYMDEAELCHRTALLSEGRLVRFESPRQMTEDYPYSIWEVLSLEQGIKERLMTCYHRDVYAFGDRYHLVTDDQKRTGQELAALLTGYGADKQARVVKASLEDVFILYQDGGTP